MKISVSITKSEKKGTEIECKLISTNEKITKWNASRLLTNSDNENYQGIFTKDTSTTDIDFKCGIVWKSFQFDPLRFETVEKQLKARIKEVKEWIAEVTSEQKKEFCL